MRRPRILPLVVTLLPLLAAGCGKLAQPVQPEPPAGSATYFPLTFIGDYRDEYGRLLGRPSGTIYASAFSEGKYYPVTLTPSVGTVTLSSFPYPKTNYMVYASQQGCYPKAIWMFTPLKGFPELSRALCTMNRIPPPEFRIDSLACFVNTAPPRIVVRIRYGTILPPGGTRMVALFAGTGPEVGPHSGTYLFADTTTTRDELVSFVDLRYQDLAWHGFASGQRVYVTGRLGTAQTQVTTDEHPGLLVFTDVEEYTMATTSFVMP